MENKLLKGRPVAEKIIRNVKENIQNNNPKMKSNLHDNLTE